MPETYIPIHLANQMLFEGTAVKLNFTKCEVFGCVISLTNNSKDDAIVSLFNQIKASLNKSVFLN